MNNTSKLYYKDFFSSECEASVIDVSKRGIVFDRTVAFPEGGGQEGDMGTIIIKDSKKTVPNIAFIDTQKGFGRIIELDDFPEIEVDSPIYHSVEGNNLECFENGMKVHIKIDVERRAKITVNHTGIHMVLMALEKLRPNISKSIKGAHIGIDNARLDFSTNERFTSSELEETMQLVNEIVDHNEEIEIFHHPEEPEAWYWKCMDAIYPCGGTHLSSAGHVGHINLKRKNLGKGSERIIATYPNAKLPLEAYHPFNDI